VSIALEEPQSQVGNIEVRAKLVVTHDRAQDFRTGRLATEPGFLVLPPERYRRNVPTHRRGHGRIDVAQNDDAQILVDEPPQIGDEPRASTVDVDFAPSNRSR
jgi:hypothetical protein